MSKNNLINTIENIKSRTDLVNFVQSLKQDFIDNEMEWENQNLVSFFDAIAGWVEDMDGFYKNQGKSFSEDQSWKTFAEILYAAKHYE